MRFSAILLLGLVMLITACSDGGGGDSGGDANPQDDLLASIQWPQEPDHIVFRADVVGGANFDSFLRLSEVPECTVYGDGRVVWVVENAQGDAQTVFNIVTPLDIRNFVSTVTFNFDIYGQETAAEFALDTTPPVVEQLQIHINDVQHTTDILGGWDYDYYEEILQLCIDMAGQPTIFEPAGAWLSVQATEFDTRSPLQRWDADITGVDLAELAASGEPVWIEGRLLEVMWDLVERNPADLQLDQNGGIFWIALQIPNVTRSSPPTPNT